MHCKALIQNAFVLFADQSLDGVVFSKYVIYVASFDSSALKVL